MTNLKSLAVAALFFGSSAFAAWTPIASINTPYTGGLATFAKVKTGKISVSKSGEGCPNTLAAYSSAQGFLTTGQPVNYGLQEIGQTQEGAKVYQLTYGFQQVVATVHSFSFQTLQTDGRPCTYTFSAETF
jgi:hypothetical protein